MGSIYPSSWTGQQLGSSGGGIGSALSGASLSRGVAAPNSLNNIYTASTQYQQQYAATNTFSDIDGITRETAMEMTVAQRYKVVKETGDGDLWFVTKYNPQGVAVQGEVVYHKAMKFEDMPVGLRNKVSVLRTTRDGFVNMDIGRRHTEHIFSIYGQVEGDEEASDGD